MGAPPDRLWVHQEGIYRDEYQRTWVAVVEQVTLCFAYFFFDFAFKSTLFLTSHSVLKVFGFIFDHFFPSGDEFPKGTNPASSGSLR